jgi:hypothetical protein
MRITCVTVLFFAGLVLSSCFEKPVPEGFVCVKPLSPEQLKKADLDASNYQPTETGKYVPKGWVPVPSGPYQGCYVPSKIHDLLSTVPGQ